MKKIFGILLFTAFILIATRVHALPFRQFKTDRGLRVWLLPQESADTVSISVHVPVGSSLDPKGKEGLAHYVEHMLFTDNDGRDELEFFKELEGKGGKANGYTERDHTVYTIDAPAKEVSLAVDWTRRLLFDHRFKQEAAEKERKIVILESDLKPLEPLDYLKKIFEALSIFKKPDFWEKEFGIKEDDREIGGTYASVNRIAVQDLQEFFSQHYRPERITFFMAGRFNPDVVEQLIKTRFTPAQAILPADKPGMKQPKTLKIRRGYHQTVRFRPAGTLNFHNIFKFYLPTQDEAMGLFFIEDFLREHLNDELRFKGRTTYAVESSISINRNAGYLSIQGDFSPDDLASSKAIIEETFVKLKSATFPDDQFDEYKKRARSVLDLRAVTPSSQSRLFREYYYNAAIFHSFPDAKTFYDSMTQKNIQDIAQKWFVPENQVRFIDLQAPLSDTTQAILAVLFGIAVLIFLKRRWVKEVNLKELRYLRKFRYPIAQLILVWSVGIALYVFYQEILGFGFERIEEFYQQFPVFSIHLFFDFLKFGLWIYFALLPFTFYPRKVMLFTHYMVIKFATFRSWKISYEDLQRIEPMHFPQYLNWKKNGFTWPLALGLFQPGIYVKAKKRPGLFFSTRNNPEFLSALQSIREENLREKN